MKIIEIKTTTNDAESALKNAGFHCLSSWVLENRFEKDGKTFKIAHPIWNLKTKSVRIEEIIL